MTINHLFLFVSINLNVRCIYYKGSILSTPFNNRCSDNDFIIKRNVVLESNSLYYWQYRKFTLAFLIF